ncbi:MAG TPA: glycosyl hydrolase [Flavisolibacter sp.]|nr:glycosyl hydrolase [Flavisolibacter sp.]
MRTLQLAVSIVWFLLIAYSVEAQDFVQRRQQQFYLRGQPYYYIGANYWYGSSLALLKDRERGVERLRKELDFLRSKGITNLRVLAGAEGSGTVNGVERVAPALQPEKGTFDAGVLKGLDLLLAEMGKRGMKAVVFLSNNWEWSGGFLQYLRWNNRIDEATFRRKLSWDEMRDYVSKFYTCAPCRDDYNRQLDFMLDHTNSVTGKKYKDDPAIMAWELANEPRPMRPASNEAYLKWIRDVAARIKSKDKNHLVTLGHEGYMGTESLPLFEEAHRSPNVDYLTIHIWPKNWGWFSEASFENDFPRVLDNTQQYIDQHKAVADRLQKPLVIEEFGLPRDGHSFDVTAATTLRDRYYESIFSRLQQSAASDSGIAGANFWAFGGLARPVKGQTFWKAGDDYMGDPPMEEQGLNSVFDSDHSTWNLIYRYAAALHKPHGSAGWPADRMATKETVSLYAKLKKVTHKGILFGHQDDLAYGVGWKYVEGKSDVKELTGDYPAVYGWELGNIEHGLPYNLDSVPFDKMRHYIQQGYQRGGVITISWHLDNPLNGESAWDTTHGGVAAALPGGSKNELYRSWMDQVAGFLLSLRGQKGEYIPILFRPYHELTGNWFWWCRNTCTPAEFQLLYRYTIDYLRQEKGIHHLLTVYNTADFNSREEFLERYPGDDMVDVVSFDSYQYKDPQKDPSFVNGVHKRLTILDSMASEKGKLVALAETGYEAIPYANWWTQTLMQAIGDHKISYVLAWRNHGLQPNGHWHYYVPKKGDVSAADFIQFYKHPKILFEKDIAKEGMYK